MARALFQITRRCTSQASTRDIS